MGPRSANGLSMPFVARLFFRREQSPVDVTTVVGVLGEGADEPDLFSLRNQ